MKSATSMLHSILSLCGVQTDTLQSFGFARLEFEAFYLAILLLGTQNKNHVMNDAE